MPLPNHLQEQWFFSSYVFIAEQKSLQETCKTGIDLSTNEQPPRNTLQLSPLMTSYVISINFPLTVCQELCQRRTLFYFRVSQLQHSWHQRLENPLLWGAVLCIVGCLAAPLPLQSRSQQPSLPRQSKHLWALPHASWMAKSPLWRTTTLANWILFIIPWAMCYCLHFLDEMTRSLRSLAICPRSYR